MEHINDLLKGAIDLHQHLGPSIIPRELDVVEGVKEAKEAGFKAIAVKDHQFPTIAHAEIAKKHFGQDADIYVFSGIVLNHEVGGLNVYALETAINMGVKMVWMPTVSTENHHVKHSQGGLKFPASKKKSALYKQPYIPILKEDGSVTDDVYRVLGVIAENEHVVMGTGHGSAKEIDAIIKTAAKLGVKNIVVNHPSYMIDATIEQMKEWTDLGAYMEIGACTSDPLSRFCSKPIEQTVDLIREIGVQHIILGSDYGQTNNPRPVEGLKHFIGLLLEKGFQTEDIKAMIQVNPQKILGI